MFRTVVKLFFSSISVLLLFLFCHGKKPTFPPPVVFIIKVIQKDIPIYSEWIGNTDGTVNATIRPQVQGYLTAKKYTEGSFVKAGQLLFEIDPRPFEIALEQATAQFKMSQSQQFVALRNLNRTRPLTNQYALSRRDLDNAVGTARNAKGSVQAAKAAVDMARLNLSFTKITSPIDGIAGLSQAQIGDLVGPSQTMVLTTVSAINPIQVNFSISERDYLRYINKFIVSPESLKTVSSLIFEMFLADGSLYPYTGKFNVIDRQVNPQTGTIELQALFPNPFNRIRPGQFARLRVTTGIKRGALLVPQRAVTQVQNGFMVAVVNDSSKIDIRTVKTGVRVGTLWEIISGVKFGECIVAEGIQKIRPGEPVTPRPFVQEEGNGGEEKNVLMTESDGE